MRTAQEQQLINKIAHAAHKLTPQEIQAITAEMLNSTINDDSARSAWSVAFALAQTHEGSAILALDGCALGSQINAKTLNAIIQQGPCAGQSVALALGLFHTGLAVLAANNNTIGRRINAETLNAIVAEGLYAGWSVAFILARSVVGKAILAFNNNMLSLQINAQTLNTIIQGGGVPGWSVAYALLRSAPEEGCAILAANNHALALRLNTLNKNLVGYVLSSTAEGRAILDKIRDRHQNNNTMLALYSSKIERLGKRSKIRMLQKELLGNVLTMLDGRTPQRLGLT